MTQADKLAALEAHVSTCDVCSIANKRANDFCERGRLMFYDDEEQSIRVIAQALERARKAGSN